MTAAQPHPALAHRCPLCGADPGQACRAVRSGRAAEKPHAARITVCNPRYKAENRALCCRCGQLRTVAHKHKFRYDDHAFTLERDEREPGRNWRMTGTLDCAECGQPTVHAILRDSCDPQYRDYAELRDYGLVD